MHPCTYTNETTVYAHTRPGVSMKLNEKSVASFAVCSSPIDKEGYLSKKAEGRGFQRRWFVLKGNLLFYFEKKQDKEPQGVVVLEACSVQASSQVRYAFEISFDGVGTRTYVIQADNDEDMQSWMKAISHSSYEYLRTIVNELQRRVNDITSSSKPPADSDMSLLHVGPAKAPPSGAPATNSAALLAPAYAPTTSPSPITEASSPKVKIRNGILVDIDEKKEEEEEEEAPPVPLKARDRALRDRATPTMLEDTEATASKSPSRTVYQLRTLPPHSSPCVAPVHFDPIKPLSPSATFDRTAVLEPSFASSGAKDDSGIDYSPPPVRAQKSDAAEALNPEPGSKPREESVTGTGREPPGLFDMASSHPPPRKLVSGPSTKKNIFEMHEEFSKAMEDLKSERTARF